MAQYIFPICLVCVVLLIIFINYQHIQEERQRRREFKQKVIDKYRKETPLREKSRDNNYPNLKIPRNVIEFFKESDQQFNSDNLLKQKNLLENRKLVLDNSINKLNQKKKMLEGLKKSYNEEVELYNNLLSEYETQNAEYEEEKKAIYDEKKRLDEEYIILAQETIRLSSSKEDKLNKYTQLEEQYKSNLDLIQYAENINEEIQSYRNKNNDIINKIIEVKEKLESIEEEKTRLENNISAQKSIIEDLDKKKDETEKEIKNIEEISKEYRKQMINSLILNISSQIMVSAILESSVVRLGSVMKNTRLIRSMNSRAIGFFRKLFSQLSPASTLKTLFTKMGLNGFKNSVPSVLKNGKVISSLGKSSTKTAAKSGSKAFLYGISGPTALFIFALDIASVAVDIADLSGYGELQTQSTLSQVKNQMDYLLYKDGVDSIKEIRDDFRLELEETIRNGGLTTEEIEEMTYELELLSRMNRLPIIGPLSKLSSDQISVLLNDRLEKIITNDNDIFLVEFKIEVESSFELTKQKLNQYIEDQFESYYSSKFDEYFKDISTPTNDDYNDYINLVFSELVEEFMILKFTDYINDNMSNLIDRIYEELCVENGGKVVGKECSYRDENSCTQSYSIPLGDGDIVTRWIPEANNGEGLCEAYTSSYLEHCVDKNGLRSNYDRKKHKCNLTKNYCQSKGASYKNGDCYIPIGQQISEFILGTTATRNLRQIFSGDQYCPCPPGFRDDGLFCAKTTKPVTIEFDWFDSKSTCPYGYDMVWPLCWKKCPDKFYDIGVSCAKPRKIKLGKKGQQTFYTGNCDPPDLEYSAEGKALKEYNRLIALKNYCNKFDADYINNYNEPIDMQCFNPSINYIDFITKMNKDLEAHIKTPLNFGDIIYLSAYKNFYVNDGENYVAFYSDGLYNIKYYNCNDVNKDLQSEKLIYNSNVIDNNIDIKDYSGLFKIDDGNNDKYFCYSGAGQPRNAIKDSSPHFTLDNIYNYIRKLQVILTNIVRFSIIKCDELTKKSTEYKSTVLEYMNRGKLQFLTYDYVETLFENITIFINQYIIFIKNTQANNLLFSYTKIEAAAQLLKHIETFNYEYVEQIKNRKRLLDYMIFDPRTRSFVQASEPYLINENMDAICDYISSFVVSIKEKSNKLNTDIILDNINYRLFIAGSELLYNDTQNKIRHEGNINNNNWHPIPYVNNETDIYTYKNTKRLNSSSDFTKIKYFYLDNHTFLFHYLKLLMKWYSPEVRVLKQTILQIFMEITKLAHENLKMLNKSGSYGNISSGKQILISIIDRYFTFIKYLEDQEIIAKKKIYFFDISKIYTLDFLLYESDLEKLVFNELASSTSITRQGKTYDFSNLSLPLQFEDITSLGNEKFTTSQLNFTK
jgi:hypothetical protein